MVFTWYQGAKVYQENNPHAVIAPPAWTDGAMLSFFLSLKSPFFLILIWTTECFAALWLADKLTSSWTGQPNYGAVSVDICKRSIRILLTIYGKPYLVKIVMRGRICGENKFLS